MARPSRLALIDALLIGVAIIVALLAGLAFGPLLSAGDADPRAFLFPLLGAAVLVGGLAVWRRQGWLRWFLPGWTLTGAVLAALLLTGLASGRWPVVVPKAMPDAPRISLALFTALDLEQQGRGARPALDRRFAVERLDALTAEALANHRRLLLAQPRLMTPQELVDLDAWIRGGRDALILADPLLVWPGGYAPGDRRAPPLTSLLDPLLAHWGLRLDPAESSATKRRFAGQHLLRAAGASRFVVRKVADARCDVEADGWMALCHVGRGRVRLIADADLLDARLWRADGGDAMASDAILLVDHWLRAPLMQMPDGAARMWVRDETSLRTGVRAAIAFGIVWAILGGVLVWRRERMGKAGSEDHLEKKAVQLKEQL